MKKLAACIVPFALGCGSSTAPAGQVAEPEPTAVPAAVETSVAPTAEPSSAPAHSGHTRSHSGAPLVYEELAKAYHDVGHGTGESGKCHEICHKGDAHVCEKERESCLKLCAEAPKGGH